MLHILGAGYSLLAITGQRKCDSDLLQTGLFHLVWQFLVVSIKNREFPSTLEGILEAENLFLLLLLLFFILRDVSSLCSAMKWEGFKGQGKELGLEPTVSELKSES